MRPGRVMGMLAGVLMLALTGPALAANLTSPAERARIRDLADRGVEPMVSQRAALLADATAPWQWGRASGEFVTTPGGDGKRCHPAGDPAAADYLKEGAPDAYAKVLAALLEGDPEGELVTEARARLLDLVDTTGFHGLGGQDHSGANQCILELGLSVPVWIETAKLLEQSPVWREEDRTAFAGWLARVAYPRVAWASRVRRNNWGAAGSAAASLIAEYVDDLVPDLVEVAPAARTLTPIEARVEHEGMQLARIGTTWRGDTRCDIAGIQPHGGIPDELRRGEAGCEGTHLPSGDDPSHTYQTMHVEILALHAEAQRRQGRTSLYDARVDGGDEPAILQAILFVIDNPSPGGLSWPWGPRTGTLAVALRHYGDPRLARALDAAKSPTARGGRTLPYARIMPTPPAPPALIGD